MDPKKITTVRNSINAGGITYFAEIFHTISKRAMADQLGMNYTRFRDLVKDPTGFKYSENYSMAKILGVQAKQLSELIHNQVDIPPKPERRKLK